MISMNETITREASQEKRLAGVVGNFSGLLKAWMRMKAGKRKPITWKRNTHGNGVSGCGCHF
jgi:hypothetical protein